MGVRDVPGSRGGVRPLARHRPVAGPGRNGHARSLSARNQLGAAITEAQEAVRLSPREGEFHNTVGAIYQRMHRFKEAAASFVNYVNLLPDRDRGERAVWARESIKFLESFNNRAPLDFGEEPLEQVWTVPVRLLGDKVFFAPKSTARTRSSSSTPAPSRRSSRASSRGGAAWRPSRTQRAPA